MSQRAQRRRLAPRSLPEGPLLAAALLLGSVDVAAERPADGGSGFRDTVTVGYVLIPVSVRSRSGFVTDLEAQDFELFVDNRPVEIESFDRGADVPLSLVFLQDLSGSMAIGEKLEESRRALACFLDRRRAGDRYALATFAGPRLEVEVPFTSDITVLRDAMARWRPYGTTALHDAVARLPEITSAGAHPRRTVVLITDGAENASRLTPPEAREIVQRADLPVYVLSLIARAPGRAEGEGSSLERYAELLRRLAIATGGRYASIVEPGNLGAACREIDEELRSRYVLGFSTAVSGESLYRSLRVAIRRRGLRYSHRRGYLGTPPG